MATSLAPINPSQIITPTMITSARRVLGACNQAATKLATFRAAGFPFPDQEQMNDDLRQKAEGLLAAAGEHYDYSGNGNGTVAST